MKPDITEIRKDREINLLIEKGNEVLRELGYTEHSRKHAAKAAETADQYIEKVAIRIGRRYRTTVATSDGVIQLIIRSQGCILWSARDFREEIERVGKLISEEKGKHTGNAKNYLFAHADEETQKYLEAVRLGKNPEIP